MRARSWRRDRRGSVAILFAVASLGLLCLTGLVVDIGNAYQARRALQGAADVAAIAAASDLTKATQAAQANALSNQFTASEVMEVTPGIYTRDASLAASARFQPSALSAANAVKVVMTHQQPLTFGGLLLGKNSVTLSASAIASRTQVASFGLGSGVASLNGGIVNALLKATLGSQVSLAAVDYNALIAAQVNLFGLANAIAARIGQPSASYAQVFSRTIAMTDFIAALEQVSSGVMPQLQTLMNAATSGTATVDLSRLIEFGPYASLPVSGSEPQITATASVFSLIQAAGQVGGAAHLLSLNLNVGIPGLANVTALLTLGEPPVGTTILAVDQTGVSLHTAQIRLYLKISLASAINLPLYLELGYGTATLAGISCSPLDSSQTSVTLNVTPGLEPIPVGHDAR